MLFSGKRFLQRSFLAISVVAFPMAAGAYFVGKQALAHREEPSSPKDSESPARQDIQDAPIPSKQAPFEAPSAANLA